MKATETELRVHIRWMTRKDHQAVLTIEAASFPHPWTEDDFLTQMRKKDVIAMVAEVEDKVVGFFVYQTGKKTLRLLDLAVHPDYRRKGVGERMVGKLLCKLSQHKRQLISLAVCERNLPAQQFLKFMGFKATRVEEVVYENEMTGEVYEMEYRLDQLEPVAVKLTNRISEYFWEASDGGA